MAPGLEVVQVHAVVHGEVQGVGFRWFVLERARSLQLAGWVRNRLDGAVECVAQGPQDDLERLVAEMRRGPIAALVERVDERWGAPEPRLPSFEIRP